MGVPFAEDSLMQISVRVNDWMMFGDGITRGFKG